LPDYYRPKRNGVFYGNTPVSVSLNPGIHAVTISLAGYEPWTKKVNAVEGFSVKATLVKKEKPTDIDINVNDNTNDNNDN
jgi:hypothetical protein